VRSPAGKPSFAVGGPHFSVSHSGPHWACCFAGENVGLDIQERREVDAVRLAERFFTPAEAACCRRGGVEMFYRIWVRKEALVKYADCTLARLLGRAQVADESGVKDRVFWHGEVVALREFRLGETIIGAVAAKEIKQLCLREMSGRKQI
jgi:phosphopantetheinyl transferase